MKSGWFGSTSACRSPRSPPHRVTSLPSSGSSHSAPAARSTPDSPDPGFTSPAYGSAALASGVPLRQYSLGGRVARITRTPAACACATMLVSDVCTDVADSQSATPQPHYPRQTRARRSQPRVQLHPLHLAAIRQPRPAPPAYGSAGVGAGPWFPCAGFVQNADGGSSQHHPHPGRRSPPAAPSPPQSPVPTCNPAIGCRSTRSMSPSPPRSAAPAHPRQSVVRILYMVDRVGAVRRHRIARHALVQHPQRYPAAFSRFASASESRLVCCPATGTFATGYTLSPL